MNASPDGGGEESNPGAHESIWMATSEGRSYPTLSGNRSVDVAVVGGGVVGVTAARHLKDAGRTRRRSSRRGRTGRRLPGRRWGGPRRLRRLHPPVL